MTHNLLPMAFISVLAAGSSIPAHAALVSDPAPCISAFFTVPGPHGTPCKVPVEICSFELTQSLTLPTGGAYAASPATGNVAGMPGTLCFKADGCAGNWRWALGQALAQNEVVNLTLCCRFMGGSPATLVDTTTITLGALSGTLPSPGPGCPGECQTYTLTALAVSLAPSNATGGTVGSGPLEVGFQRTFDAIGSNPPSTYALPPIPPIPLPAPPFGQPHGYVFTSTNYPNGLDFDEIDLITLGGLGGTGTPGSSALDRTWRGDAYLNQLLLAEESDTTPGDNYNPAIVVPAAAGPTFPLTLWVADNPSDPTKVNDLNNYWQQGWNYLMETQVTVRAVNGVGAWQTGTFASGFALPNPGFGEL